MNNESRGQVARIMLTVIILSMLIAGSLWTLKPFLGGLIWATTIVVATWPALLMFQRNFGGKRSWAVVAMTLIVLVAFITPFILAIDALLGAAERSPTVLQSFLARGLNPPPDWIGNIPLVGERIAAKWLEISAGGPEGLVETVRPYTREAAAWVLAATGGLGVMVLNVLFMVVLMAILYASGETAANGVLGFFYRLGGTRGEEIVHLAAKAVRSVALGVVVTALVQSVLAGVGLWVSGIPYPGVLTAIVFILGIAQLGPLLVLAPAVAWLYWIGSPGWGTALLVWSIPVIALDNVLRPILIRRGVELPMLLIIAGVIGGLIGFGVLGLFIGPVILAATYTLTKAWIAEARRPAEHEIDVQEIAEPPMPDTLPASVIKSPTTR